MTEEDWKHDGEQWINTAMNAFRNAAARGQELARGFVLQPAMVA